jgi:Bifunctional DNA primase/polymerase, N-terminal/AAA domain
LPEAPTPQQVQFEANFLSLVVGEQGVRELCAHFGAESADDLAEADRREFIRLAKLSEYDRAEVLSKRTVPPAIPVEMSGNITLTMREKAVALAKEGFRVFPVKKGTKKPAQPPNKPWPPKGQYHQHIPSRDLVDVAAMWTGPRGQSLTFDIGINTEGLLVLDIDDRDGRTGNASFNRLALEHGLDLDTVTVSTPSGGLHYYYKLPQGIDPSTVKSASDKLGSGIDHRSYNSLVVAPGTVRAGKGEYRWLRSPEDTEMKVVPLSLVELCRREHIREPHDPIVVSGLELDTPEAVERFRHYAAKCAPEAVEGAGGRNATVTVLRRAGDYGVSWSIATEILCEEGGWNETKAIPPWDYGELLDLAETLEPSRDQPIGCDHPVAQFEAVPIFSSLPPLTLAEWKARDLPPPDYICGNWLSTTSRVLLVAPTGLGKTMFGVGLTMAIAGNRDFVHWKRRRPAKVLFIDGEMSNRLLRKRLLDEARRLGVSPETFYALSHEDVPNFAPLNTVQGQALVNAVIEKLGGVDLIEFDNTMSLIAGDHREEEGWRQTLPWVRSLTQ